MRQIPENRRRHLVPDELLGLWELLVSACAVLNDPADDRQWGDRLSTLWASADTDVNLPALERLLEALGQITEGELVTEARARIARPQFQAFVERLVGSAAYTRLRVALSTDVAVIAVALQAGGRLLMPWAQAVQDVLNVLGDDESAGDLRLATAPAQGLLAITLQLDQALGGLVEAALRSIIDESTVGELLNDTETSTTSIADQVAELMPRMREVISDRSRTLADQLSTNISRKIRGAKDAITSSADPVSQAANSLIELIDRLLRTAFSDSEVLDWLDENYPGRANLRYEKQGVTRPTKRGQALCFVNAGQPKVEQPVAWEMLAACLVLARTRLQALKHADEGTSEEMDELLDLMAAVEALFALIIGLVWRTEPRDKVSVIYARLDPTARPGVASGTAAAPSKIA